MANSSVRWLHNLSCQAVLSLYDCWINIWELLLAFSVHSYSLSKKNFAWFLKLVTMSASWRYWQWENVEDAECTSSMFDFHLTVGECGETCLAWCHESDDKLHAGVLYIFLWKDVYIFARSWVVLCSSVNNKGFCLLGWCLLELCQLSHFSSAGFPVWRQELIVSLYVPVGLVVQLNT